jgi:nitroreductase
MTVFEGIRGMRAVRRFADRPLPEKVLGRILEAGRWAGSAKNRQPWHFIVVRDRALLDRLATCGQYASHLRGAAVAVVIVTGSARWDDLDAGRCGQNMMLAAWAEGVGSCIASLHHEAKARTALGVPDGMKVQMAISFGYPAPGPDDKIEGLPKAQVLASLGRKPLDELVHRDRW